MIRKILNISLCMLLVLSTACGTNTKSLTQTNQQIDNFDKSENFGTNESVDISEDNQIVDNLNDESTDSSFNKKLVNYLSSKDEPIATLVSCNTYSRELPSNPASYNCGTTTNTPSEDNSQACSSENNCQTYSSEDNCQPCYSENNCQTYSSEDNCQPCYSEDNCQTYYSKNNCQTNKFEPSTTSFGSLSWLASLFAARNSNYFTPYTSYYNQTPDTSYYNQTPDTSDYNQTPETSDGSFTAEVLRLVNVERARYNLSPVTSDDTLNKAANIRAQEIISKFDHVRPNGQSCFSVLNEMNIRYQTCGENIAAGQQTPEEVVTAWMNSEGHRKNILNPNFTKLGVGYVTGGNYRHNWVQLFARFPN